MTAPAQPNRHSVRLKDYDYRTAGGYFITICTADRRPLFDDPRVRHIVNIAWNDIPNHHPQVEIDEFVVMPNHMHGVLFLGASHATDVRAQQAAPLQRSRSGIAAGALGTFVRSFKARVTRDVRAAGSDVAVWQRNYHEHVVRNDQALHRIRQYVLDNPARWEFDQENPAGRPDRIERDFGDWLNHPDPHFAANIGAPT